MEIQKDSIRDQVRRTLTERILAGHYQPGDRLVELQIVRGNSAPVRVRSVRQLRELEASRLSRIGAAPWNARACGESERIARCLLRREESWSRLPAARTAAKAFKGNIEKLRQEVQGVLDAAQARDLAAQAAHVRACTG